MNELYWISRLDIINGWLVAFVVVSLSLLVISFIVCKITNVCRKTAFDESDRISNRYIYVSWKPVRKWSCIACALLIPIFILTPTTKEAFMIWGVGGTIDYIKSNDKIQQLPDKCIDALDAWVESLSEDKKNKEQ